MRRLAKQLLPPPVRTQVKRIISPERRRRDRRRHESEAACPLPGGIVTRLENGELPHFCLPLEHPEWVAPGDASYLVPDDSILGFEIDDRHYAVPWDVMAAHHVANLELGGRHWTLTLCDMCVGGGLYEATLGDTTFRFRVDGLYGGTPYVKDQQTGSLWTMVTMRPIHGPAVDLGPLVRHPIVHATWAAWSAMHPDTLVVHDPGEPEDGHGGDARAPDHTHYPAFAEDRLAPPDDRLPGLDLVLGVEIGDDKRAYPLEELHRAGGVVNDVVGGRPIVAVAVPGTFVAIAFFRDIGDDVVELAWVDATPDLDRGEPMLVDDRTGSHWNLFGTAVAGPLEGRQLTYVWGGLEKWFNWSNLAAGTSIWSAA
jgi:hypothetical protein